MTQHIRSSRFVRCAGTALVAIFAVVGLVAAYQFFFGAPGVGHFRSADGRDSYVAAYERAMAMLPPPSAVHDVPTRFGTVRVYEWTSPQTADSVPVILVPGRASGVPMWGENLPGFLPEHRVLAFDALGDAGLSIQAAPLTSTDEQALWIDDALSGLGVETAHVVGHSFGGASAASHAKQFPEKVRSLTLLEPVFTFGYPPARVVFWASVSTLPGLPAGWRDTALAKVGGVDDYDSDDAMAAMISEGSEHFSAALPTPSPLSDDELRALAMPTYVAIAERDSLAGGEKSAARARQLADAEVLVFPDTTHSLPMQAKDRLNSELPEFWRGVEQD
ncbi:pimeloyl-ACP methyl ester carboxylesterase [Rhodococcus rhodochrous J45]|uniref:Pimeloyl-ACP methyl ester carboxylesterase n=1 Tax=Rhodococcus rhodochrous J45 TaxID=935266 RepID=A0A562E6K2_RHORH|nr:alpha/beta hydrolase [Rhodococcus rhodochrous]TWH17752.1 pimeloyl-ACP methyl ester carboxylesterase [Rhodococcus rhodochrous J45]